MVLNSPSLATQRLERDLYGSQSALTSDSKRQPPRRVAIVHDWFDTLGGAERVARELIVCFPDADVFAIVDMLSDENRGLVCGKKVYTTFIQNLPGARKHFRRYLPLMPIAIEQFDLSDYDLVISSSWAVAKGVITGPDQLHVAYVHTPIRYAWDQQHHYLKLERLDRGIRGVVARLALHWIRLWDLRTVNNVDVWLANSRTVKRRIRKTYGRNAEVLYPPVPVDEFPFTTDKATYYFTCSRLVRYKRVDLMVDAFLSRPNSELVIAGDGPELSALKERAGGATNIRFLGHRPDSEVRELMRNARAFVFAANEDLGIVPIEAQACGTPVIAFGQGGALETVRGLGADRPTGCFFDRQTPASLLEAIDRFENLAVPIAPEHCRANASRFTSERFREQLHKLVSRHWNSFDAAVVSCIENDPFVPTKPL
ncbi:MAG: glycosyltransferase [Alphaproteobacteria bacterium]|nr:glycosyltransferase [Alphaproteobacteria bacterium]MBV8406087.1 glycosyltransferase [Alphaproteobacteria bacterium]